MKRALICLALSLNFLPFASPPATAQVGLYTGVNTTVITSPVNAQSYVIDNSTVPPQLRGYYTPNGGSPGWNQMTPAYFNYSGSGAPGVNQDNTQNYQVGSVYYDSVGLNLYVCSNASTGAAVWTQMNGTLLPANVNAKLTESDMFADYVVSGLLGSVPASSLTMSTPSGVAYVGGTRITPGLTSNTYTASKDTYDYLQSGGTINHVAVANNASAPTGQTGLFLQKVVSGSSSITSVTQTVNISGPAVSLNAQQFQILTGSSPYWLPITIVGGAVTAARIYTVPEVGTNAYFQLGTSVSGTTGDPLCASGSIAPSAFTFVGLNNGGTGARLSPTAGGLVWSGNSALAVGAVGTSGMPWISNGTSAPSAAAVLTVAGGGSGLGTLTAHAVQVGAGTGKVTQVSPATTGYPLLSAGATSDPAFAQITAAGIANATITTTQISGSAGITSAQLANTAVTANTYATPSSITVNAQGQVTALTAGSVINIGGNGTDGSVTVSSTIAETTIRQRNTSSFSLTGANTYTVISGTKINSTSTITIGDSSNAGVFAVATNAAGGIGTLLGTAGVEAQAGAGPAGGQGGTTAASVNGGGAGGGCGGAGGNGGAASATNAAFGGGALAPSQGLIGSGGGGGSFATAGTPSGGAGGGNVTLIASGNIVIAASATLKALGAAGTSGSSTFFTGGGGGSGGVISMYSETGTVTITGTVSVAGGNGANGSAAADAGGGGGGAGIVLAMSPSAPSHPGTVTVSGGSAGTNGTAVATAGAGSTALYVTGTPSLPLMTMHEKWLPKMVAAANIETTIAAIRNHEAKANFVEWTKRHNIADICQWEGGDMLQQLKTCQQLTNADGMTVDANYETFSALGVDETTEQLRNAA